MTLVKWGTEEQRRKWLPMLAKGDIIGAYALTEPGCGSAIQSIETTFREEGDKFILNGKKKWISYGQLAGVFLVFGKIDGKPLACLVPKEAEGLTVKPIKNMMGFRAARLAQISFNEVEFNPRISSESLDLPCHMSPPSACSMAGSAQPVRLWASCEGALKKALPMHPEEKS